MTVFARPRYYKFMFRVFQMAQIVCKKTANLKNVFPRNASYPGNNSKPRFNLPEKSDFFFSEILEKCRHICMYGFAFPL